MAICNVCKIDVTRYNNEKINFNPLPISTRPVFKNNRDSVNAIFLKKTRCKLILRHTLKQLQCANFLSACVPCAITSREFCHEAGPISLMPRCFYFGHFLRCMKLITNPSSYFISQFNILTLLEFSLDVVCLRLLLLTSTQQVTFQNASNPVLGRFLGVSIKTYSILDTKCALKGLSGIHFDNIGFT
jgi:hypothetical protein